MDNYFSMTIQSTSLQVLETVHIISTTKNIETLKSRFQFLLERMDTLRKVSGNRQYQADIGASVERYKSLYFDRPVQDQQLSAISKPSGFDLSAFYCQAVLSCSKLFAEEQTAEISALKNENARIKRKGKVADKIKQAIEEVKINCSSSEKCGTTLSQLEALERTFSSGI